MVSEPIRMVRHANGVEAPPERMDVTSPSFCAGFVSVLPTRVRMSRYAPNAILLHKGLTHTRKDVTQQPFCAFMICTVLPTRVRMSL